MTPSPESLRLLDDTVRANLQDIHDLYFLWLLILTGAVAAGVALEGPEIVKDVREKCFNFRPSHSAEKWIVILSSIGWLLIAVGVAGEGLIDGLLSKSDSLIQSFDNAVLEQSRSASANANERAGDANREASKARAEATDAELELAQVRLKILDRFGPRNLSRDQISRIAERLSGLSGVKIDIYVYSVEYPWAFEDAKRLSVSVIEALSLAHLDAASWQVESSCSGWGQGLLVFLPNPLPPGSDGDLKAAKQIISAMKSEIDVWPEIGPAMGTCPSTHLAGVDRKADANIKMVIGRKVGPILRPEDLGLPMSKP